MSQSNSQFIDEAIIVSFDEEQLRLKSPSCPNGFTWRGVDYRISRSLEEWCDFKRRGRYARNMSAPHAAAAARAGSWGVGRFYFKVQVASGEIFVIYYDRAPEDVDNRMGGWFVFSHSETISPTSES